MKCVIGANIKMSYRRKEATCRHRQHPVMWFFLICMLFTHLAGCSSSDNSNNSDSTTLKIGVLLPLTGPDNSEAQQTLEWTCERINAAGGVAGKSLDLVMIDTAETDFADGAAKLADDDSILAVIGPDSSKNLFEVADLFINAQKVLVSPSATSADIFRAFGGMHYIWRTVESDIAQLKVILTIATRRGATRIALITGDDHYGGTFFDWFGFLATELGLEVTAVVRYDQTTSSCEAAMATVLLSEPDFLLAVPSYIDDAVCMARQVGNAAMPVDLFFSDAAMYSALIETLGVDADGLEGVTVTSDQDHGFDQDYFDTFGTSPPDYAAQTYDALLLLAYGLEHSKGAGGKTLAESLEAVVSFRGVATGWNPAGIQQTLDLLRSGANPNICGASGPLDFDKEKFTDVIASTYGHWQMKAGTFIFEEYYSTAASSHAESISSAFNTLASEAAKQQLDGGPYDPSYDPGPLSDLWVLIAAVSKGWDNYRHQADALAFYQQMKANGISDDRIILIMEDDLADNPLNPEPGVIRNEINGKNLYTDVEIDYTLDQLTAFDIMHILANDETNRFDPAIKSSAKDNIFFFLVGHGNS